MDAETRHQLKQNELAEALGKLRDFKVDNRTRYVLAAIAVVVIGIIGYRVWRGTAERTLAGHWAVLDDLKTDENVTGANAEKLRDLISRTGNTSLKASARVMLAAALREQAFATPERRAELLNEAAAALKEASADGVPPEIRSAALYSLASVHETRGEFNDARDVYRKLTDERFAGYPLRDLAEKRLASLDRIARDIAFTPGGPPPPVAQVDQPDLGPLMTPDGAVPPWAATTQQAPQPAPGDTGTPPASPPPSPTDAAAPRPAPPAEAPAEQPKPAETP